MNKEEFINEFNDWTKEEILGRAFEICCKNIELKEIEKENQRLKEIEKEHQRINGCLHLEIKELKDRIDKTNWWLEEMLKQAKNDETKAIICGTLELLLKEIKNEMDHR